MPIQIKMPALSPTMEEGTISKWLVKEGDEVRSGDLMAEIETDKATIEFEAVDEGIIAKIEVAEGAEDVKVGAVIAILAEEGEDVAEAAASGGGASAAPSAPAPPTEAPAAPAPAAAPAAPVPAATPAPAPTPPGGRVIASPLAKRIAGQKGIDLSTVQGSGPNGRIVKADVENVGPASASAPAVAPAMETPAPASEASSTAPKMPANDLDAPYEEQKLSNIRKVIAKRLTAAKQEVPHYYLTSNIRLDALLALRKELNGSLEAEGVKLSVNDLLIKALARALQRVPVCNVSFHGDTVRNYSRADISVAVAAPSGLITPIVRDAGRKGVAEISTEMKALVEKAREGKLQPQDYQGGTASISNLGPFGISQFEAVINPPQSMILAVGAGEQRPHVIDGALGVATVMSATGSFDHRAIDGAEGAQLMQAIKDLVEDPMGLLV